MKFYTANSYFQLQNGLDIKDESKEVVINIKASSSNEIMEIANKVLTALNSAYKQRAALLADNQKNYDMGYLTPAEKDERINEINSMKF